MAIVYSKPSYEGRRRTGIQIQQRQQVLLYTCQIFYLEKYAKYFAIFRTYMFHSNGRK